MRRQRARMQDVRVRRRAEELHVVEAVVGQLGLEQAVRAQPVHPPPVGRVGAQLVARERRRAEAREPPPGRARGEQRDVVGADDRPLQRGGGVEGAGEAGEADASGNPKQPV